ncbi:MAG: DUF5689 domain-containing protein, partial [Bacteroidales bacterium]|nr:DUF5689 domain-containing protein [Bacteroidales bacterium]
MMKTIYSTVNTRRFFPFLSTLVAVSLMMVVACNITESEPDSGPPNLSVTPAALHFAYGGGEQTITITSNISWAITTPPNWIEVSEKFNAGNAIITVTAPPFDTGELAREGSFTVRTAEGLEATVTIAQGGVPLVTTETSVSNITDITAELSGSWVFSDPVTISEAGVWVKRTGSADSVKFTVAAPSDTPGPFTVTATDLQHSANYTYRAYVITSGGNYAPSKTTGTFTTAEVLSIRQFLSDAGAGSITTNQLKQVTTNSYILATVLSDYSKGNYEPDRLVLTDVLNGAATPQDALILAFNAADAPSNTYTLGHQLKIHLQNSSLYRDADGVLVDSISITAIEVLSGSATTVTPTIVTDHTQLIDYESVYVKVENTQLSQAMLTAPSWYNVPRLRFEVDGNENTYMVDVLHAAEFANTAPATGSGAIYGIVTKINATEYVVRPRNEADINQLIGDRFVSQAAFKLTDAILSGTLKKNLPSAATVTVAYENSNGTTSQIIDIADVWGVSGA